MTLSRLVDSTRRFGPRAAIVFILLLAATTLVRHIAGIGDEEEQRAAILRYQRIAADLPRLEMAARNRPAAEAPENPSLALALSQSRLVQLAGRQGLQLASAEPLLAEGRQSMALELVGGTAGLLGFVYEVERGTPAMTITRLEVTAAAVENAASEPLLRVRLQAQAVKATP
jgi:hypothetical protein